jgi:hypothetical protein
MTRDVEAETNLGAVDISEFRVDTRTYPATCTHGLATYEKNSELTRRRFYTIRGQCLWWEVIAISRRPLCS